MEKSKAGIISLIIVVVVVLGSIGALFAIGRALRSNCTSDEDYDAKMGKCIPKCYTEKTGKTYNDDAGKCICPVGKLSVGGICKTNCESVGKKSCGDNCYVPEDQQCIDNTTVCDNIRYNPETGKCCNSNELYDPKSKQCSNCPKDRTMCGNTCCDTNEQCVDGTICCNKDDVHNGQCCKSWASEDGCCDDIPAESGNGEKITSDGKNCLVTCKDGKTICNLSNFDLNSEHCSDEITTYDTNGNAVVKSVCLKKNCSTSFDQIDYDPPHITGKDGKQSVHVCKLKNNKSTPLAYCAVGGISGYTKKAISWTKDANCSSGDCEAHIGSIGAIETLFNDIPDDEGRRFCTADISCSHAEGTSVKCDVATDNGKTCPAQDESQCCQVSNKYNGLVCPDGMICINGGKCIEKHCDNCKNALKAGYGWCVKTDGTQSCITDDSNNCNDPGDVYLKGTDDFTTLKCPYDQNIGQGLSLQDVLTTAPSKKLFCSLDGSCQLRNNFQYFYYVENRTPFTFTNSGGQVDGCGPIETIEPWTGDGGVNPRWAASAWEGIVTTYTFDCSELPDDGFNFYIDDMGSTPSYSINFKKSDGVLNKYYNIWVGRYKATASPQNWRIIIYKKGYYPNDQPKIVCDS